MKPALPVFHYSLLPFLLCLCAAVASAADPYAAPAPQPGDLYLNSTSGNDANSGTSSSPKQHLSAVPWSTLAVNVWMMNGTYVMPDERHLTKQGTADNRITIASYPGQTGVILQFTDAVSPQLCGGSYVDFRGFAIHAENQGFNLSGTNPWVGSGAATAHIRFIDLTGIRNSVSYTDNSALIMIGGSAVDYIEVVRCDFSCTSAASNNQSLIWIDTTRHVAVLGCRLNGSALPIYYKHNHQATAGQVEIVFKNNVIANAGRGVLACVAYSQWVNNLFYNARLDFSDDGGNPAGDYNTVTHNTFFGTARIEMNPPQWPASTDLVAGAYGNILRNNVMAGPTAYWDNCYGIGSNFDNQTDTASNALASGSIIDRNGSSSHYSLSAYRAAFPGQETGSVQGTITFAVASPSIANKLDWALSAASAGRAAGDDGTDMGVHVTTLLTSGNSTANTAPVASGQSVTVTEDVPKDITLTAVDADGDLLTYTVGNPAHGTLSGSGANQTYAPTTGFSGNDAFTFTVNDGTANSNVATVSMTVTPVDSGGSGGSSSSGGESGGCGAGAGSLVGFLCSLGLWCGFRKRSA